MSRLALLGTGKPPGGAVAFTPASLFGGGEKGFWFDATDLATLWQTEDTSTPVTTDGQKVGRWLDKSGNGHVLVNAVDSTRPVYNTAASKHWLTFDGSDDFLTKATVNISNNIGFLTVIVAVSITSGIGTNKTLVFFSSGSSGTAAREILRASAADVPVVAGRTLDADSNVVVTGTTDVCTGVGNPFILVGEFDHANGDAFVSVGSAAPEGSNTSWHTNGNTSATDSLALTLGALNPPGGAEFHNGRMYQAVAIARLLTAGERLDLGTYFATASGAIW